MSKLWKKLYIFVGLFCLLAPQSIKSYSFSSPEREGVVRNIRSDVYEFYNTYKEVIYSRSPFQFGLFDYNGACNTVTVGGVAMPLEDYVAGVINGEVGCMSNRMEGQKALAIAARSFLLAQKAGSSSCSVASSDSFQVYRKVKANSESGKICQQVASETAGMVVVRNDKIANTQYQSYPAGQFQTQDSSGWHVTFQRWSDDPNSTWTWNGPEKSKVRSIASGANNPSYGVEMKYGNRHNWGMSQVIALYLGNGEGYTFDKIIDLFYAEPIMILSDGDYTSNVKFIKNSKFGNITYYNQNNFKQYYSSDPENKNEYGATIATHGCGPTAVAIVASSLLNKNVNPVSATARICARGGCSDGGTTIRHVKESLIKDYGLKVDATKNADQVIKALETGKALVIVLVGKGKFTTASGHYIVLSGSNVNRQVQLIDPASTSKTGQWVSFNDVAEERKASAEFLIVTK